MGAMKKTTAVVLAVLLAMATLTAVAGPTVDAAPSPGGNGAECPSGSVEDGNGMCRKPVADELTCPKGALGVPFACYIFVDKVMTKRSPSECPSGSVEDGKGNCRKPVANELTCPKGALGAPGGCYIFVDKVLPKVLKAV